LACSGPAAARSIIGKASPRRAEFGSAGSFARRWREPERDAASEIVDDPVIQGKGVHASSHTVSHGVEPRTAVSARLAHYHVSRRRSHTQTGGRRSGLAAGTGFMPQCRHRGSGPGGGVQRPHSYTRWTPVDSTGDRVGWPRAARCSPLPAG
jgi:hypothetical protein